MGGAVSLRPADESSLTVAALLRAVIRGGREGGRALLFMALPWAVLAMIAESLQLAAPVTAAPGKMPLALAWPSIIGSSALFLLTTIGVSVPIYRHALAGAPLSNLVRPFARALPRLALWMIAVGTFAFCILVISLAVCAVSASSLISLANGARAQPGGYGGTLGSAFVGVLIYVPGVVLRSYVTVRVSLVFPALALGRLELSARASWLATRGVGRTLVLALIAVNLPGLVLGPTTD